MDPANHISAPLQDVPYVDFPELKFNEHESTQMPFRYVKTDDGMPIMPKVSIDLCTQFIDAMLIV